MELKKLAPNFAVQDISKTVTFYRDVLGFKLEMVVPEDKSGVEQELSEEKKYIYAMMSRDSVQVMFQRTDSIGEDVPPLKGVPIGASVSFYIEVDDINEMLANLKSKGIKLINEDFDLMFITDRGKITPRRINGLNAKQQRDLTRAIKRARNIALLPYTATK